MEPTLTVVGHEAIDRDELPVRDWRVNSSSVSRSQGCWPRRRRQPRRLVRERQARSARLPPLLALSVVR